MDQNQIDKQCIDTVELLTKYVEPAKEDDHCENVYDRFRADTELLAIPVIANDKPIGLLKRLDFLVQLADRFGRPLYSKQPVTTLMDDAPVIINSSMKIDELNKKFVTTNQHALQEGFIVVNHGKYIGVGSAFTLLQANMLNAERKVKEISKARKIVEEASQSKSEFLANMSHELRTPLNAIIGFTDLILNYKKTEIKCESVIDYIGDIHGSGKHLLGMINNILDISRIESGKFDLMESIECPNELIDQVVRLIKPSAMTKKIDFQVNYLENDDLINIDAQLISQVLINLATNAIKFSPNDTKVTVSVKQDSLSGTSFIIKDQGPGIPVDKIDEMLKPFSQIDGAFVRNHEGTGLGLPIVKSYVEAHNGQFNIVNGPEGGAIASVYFTPARTVKNRNSIVANNIN